MLTIMLILSIAVWIFCLFMMLRIQWVHEVRLKVLHQHGYLTYLRLPSWGCMVWHFWIRDVKKFLKGAQK
ncbi:hypothetical protein M942_22790 [Enterobacter ludwigii]|jgi:hypothetical protein|uniref:hypothetical protein n=1 Tax=Enterobacter ludwigii TaxID=299767 RepID=UPI0003D8B543|nr:hypothetical protein [Enterobacter ludwigii]AHE73440.1 hypothetical protein M942_22790 [Enterobacter ludwigii]